MIWHNASADEVLSELSVNKEQGLNLDDVAYRISQFGHNIHSNATKKSFVSYLLKEITSNYSIALIIIAVIHLILATFLSTGNFLTSIVVIAVTLISATITASLKSYSERELSKLSNSVGSYVTVIRNSVECSIPATELVPGDIMLLKTGDYIRADARVIDSYVLKCDEFKVTGETVPSDKLHDTVFEAITPISGRENMVYSGSVVVNGKGVAVVTETANNTEIAKIANIEKEIDKGASPLCEALFSAKKIISLSVLIAAAIIFLFGIIVNSYSDTSFAVTVVDHLLLAVSVIVSAGLGFIPNIRNFSIVFAVKRLNNCGIKINDPEVAEKLKEIKVICTDKTGTLTSGDLSLVRIYDGKNSIDLSQQTCDDATSAILRLALICTNFSQTEHAERHSNSMEYAIESASIEHLRLSKADIDGMYPKVAELPFDSERRLMTTVTVVNGNPVAIVKGAPEVILSRCVNVNDDTFEKTAAEYALSGLKVIAVAIKQLDNIPANPNPDELENDLSFIGILGFEDKIDRAAIAQCKKCKEYGIKIVMITGDHIDTAVSIGQKLGIITSRDEAISGEELCNIDPEKLENDIDNYTIFARISPEDKLKIVKALKAKYSNVLVTGDTINDTPALLDADVGCALGRTASDIVKDTSDIIISDNRFYSIVHAIKESKRSYLDVKKAISHIVTFNLSLALIVFFGQLIFDHSPIGAAAAMLLALFAYILPTIGFFSEKYGGGVVFSIAGDNLFDIHSLIGTIITSIAIVIMTLCASAFCGNGTAFAVLSFGLLISAFSRAHSRFLISKHTLKSRVLPLIFLITLVLILVITLSPLGGLLSIGTISSNGWLTVLLTSIISFVLCEGIKFVLKFIK